MLSFSSQLLPTESSLRERGAQRRKDRLFNMYADAGMFEPFFSPPEVAAPPGLYHHLLPLSPSPSPSPSPSDEELLSRCFESNFLDDMVNLEPSCTLLEYNLGGNDLFSTPEPIIEEPTLAHDPMTIAMSIMSSEEDIIAETMSVAAMESIQEDSLLHDVFYECEADLLVEDIFPLLSEIEILAQQMEEIPTEQKIKLTAEGPIRKSVSTGCLNSADWVNGYPMTPNLLDFQGLDFEAAFGMRRAFSEGDIQALGCTTNTRNSSTVNYYVERQSTITGIKAEERREKLSRYWKKKTKRNFDKKIKYACRKALADSQPRVRGRFAKTEDCETSKQ